MAATIGAALSGPNILYDQLAHGYFFYYDTSDLTLRYLQVTFGLLAALWFVITLIRSWRAAKSPVQKRLIILLVTGMFLSQIVGVGLSGLLEVGGKLQLSSRYTLFSLTGIQFTQDIGMFLIGLGFFRISKHPWLLQRQSVQLLVVYNKDGVDLFSKRFEPNITEDRCYAAHWRIFGSFIHVSRSGKSIWSSQIYWLSRKRSPLINRKNFTCALMVDYSTQASELPHQKFTNEFEHEYGTDMENFWGDVTHFQKANKIAEQFFS